MNQSQNWQPKGEAFLSNTFLDSLKHNFHNSAQHPPRARFCGRYSLAGWVPGKDGPRYRVTGLSCKSWSCPKCAEKKRRRLSWAIVQQVQAHGLDRFLTLTMDPAKGSAAESWGQIKQAWKLFQTYMARELGKGVKFLWVVEAQKNGYAHLHILLDRYVPQAWIKAAWQGVGGGKIVFITRANVKKAGFYIAKYLTETGQAGLKPGQRRYGSSRSVNLFTRAAKAGWQVIKGTVDLLRRLAGPHVVAEGSHEDGSLSWFETVKQLFLPGTMAMGQGERRECK